MEKMKEGWKEYFSFSRKERTGMAALLVVILSIWLLPEYFGERKALPPEDMHKADSIMARKVNATGIGDSGMVKTFRLFYFDPNTLDDEGWRQLGMREKPISIIRHYLEKGGRFRRADDLLKIYSVRTDEARRLIPYIRIRQQPFSNPAMERSDFNETRKDWPYPEKWPAKDNVREHSGNETLTLKEARKGDYRQSRSAIFSGDRRHLWNGKASNVVIEAIDINSADTSAWIRLPGIGSRLAGRIVSFRERLGGFCQVHQVAEVYGISDSVYQIILPFLRLPAPSYRMLSINRMDIDSLSRHPYIRYHEAIAIVQYRKQHGNFLRKEDLLNINILSREWLEKINPYISLNVP